MILYISFLGDPSVGVFPEEYAIPCPFTSSDYDKSELDDFKEQIRKIYVDFSGGFHCYAEFDFERKYSDEIMEGTREMKEQ